MKRSLSDNDRSDASDSKRGRFVRLNNGASTSQQADVPEPQSRVPPDDDADDDDETNPDDSQQTVRAIRNRIPFKNWDDAMENQPVDRKQFRRVGPYILGPKIGFSPVDSISQYLAKKQGTDKFVLLKVPLSPKGVYSV